MMSSRNCRVLRAAAEVVAVRTEALDVGRERCRQRSPVARGHRVEIALHDVAGEGARRESDACRARAAPRRSTRYPRRSSCAAVLMITPGSFAGSRRAAMSTSCVSRNTRHSASSSTCTSSCSARRAPARLCARAPAPARSLRRRSPRRRARRRARSRVARAGLCASAGSRPDPRDSSCAALSSGGSDAPAAASSSASSAPGLVDEAPTP